MVVVSADSTRDDLIECARYLNELAKRERRRGYAGIHGQRYADLHANLDLIVGEILARDTTEAVPAA